MKLLLKIFPLAHLAVSLMFVACGLALIGFAAIQLWQGVWFLDDAPSFRRLQSVLEGIALLTVAVAALELGETVLQEEVQRGGDMSAPTRVRRFLSRFMVVLTVALAIESLVLVFRFSHDQPEHLPYAAAVGLMAAALLAAWGLFVRLNRAAEELEPEAMEETKREVRDRNHSASV
jgi:hypothetical protein